VAARRSVHSFPGYLHPRRLRVARLAALAAVIGGAFYLGWRATQLTELGPAAWGFFVAEFLTYLTLASAVPLMWTPRPRRWAPPPHGTLDVYVTVCGEDPEMVEATVQAALDIDYPHETYILNDGRIAGEEGWQEIEALAERLGVTCFTRTDGARGKAGNLNHALRHTQGEFVAVIDADHLARPDLADDLLGHFHPRVAFVATRQDFRIDARDWLGNAEVFFYGVIQPAKDADNAAFSCGNGVIYRREALEDIGGFSEWNLVEDLHTSYVLHSRGWQSVYVPRPVTTGTAPATAAEMAAQRLRWATDSLRLFFWDSPFRRPGLTWRQRMHYAQTTGVYYLATAFQIVFLLCPALSLLFGLEVIRADSIPQYGIHLAAFVIPLATMLVAFAGWRGALRLVQMQSFLAPVFTLAAWRALRMRPRRRDRAFSGVTRKSRQATVNHITLVQHGLFALLLVAVGVELASAGGIQWAAVLWALVMAGSLCTQNSMISMKWDIAQSARIALTAPVAVGSVIVLLAIWSPFPGAAPLEAVTASAEQGAGETAAAEPTPAPTPPPRRKLKPPEQGVYLGVYDPGAAVPTVDGIDLDRYRGTTPRIVHRFQQWWGDDRWFGRDWAEQVADAGAAPMITWEPWRKPPGSVVDSDQRPGLMGDIAAGRHDRFLERWARDVARFREPLVMRFAHEMNGSWYPWQANGNDNTPADFKAAFRHIHEVFDEAGATNVSWVFSIDSLAGGPPTPYEELETYYPGNRYVDWIGMSGFNWGPESVYPTERSFLSTFAPTVEVIEDFGKPLMIAEIGTSALSADPAGWLASALEDVAQLPAVKAVVWFDETTPDADFRLRGPALSAWRELGGKRRLSPRLQTRIAPERGPASG
jgi:cellulose synthase (UDP-forming)